MGGGIGNRTPTWASAWIQIRYTESMSTCVNLWHMSWSRSCWRGRQRWRSETIKHILCIKDILKTETDTARAREQDSQHRQGAHIKKERIGWTGCDRGAKCFYEVEKITLQQPRHPRTGHISYLHTVLPDTPTSLPLSVSPSNTLWGNQNRPKCHL